MLAIATDGMPIQPIEGERKWDVFLIENGLVVLIVEGKWDTILIENGVGVLVGEKKWPVYKPLSGL